MVLYFINNNKFLVIKAILFLLKFESEAKFVTASIQN